jgi:hypothetical protein
MAGENLQIPMKILFATACSETGRDGVGDYTNLLAKEVAKQGHKSAILALNDRFVDSQRIERRGDDLEVLRLPQSIKGRERGQLIADFKRRFSPDWVSLQFVPYGLNRKGIVAGWGKVLDQLARNARVHIMLHELWIGQNVSSTIRHYLIGLIQRRFIVGLLKRLNPRVVTTSCGPYLHLLEKAKVSTSKLPLFGNIPLSVSLEHDTIYRALSEAGFSVTAESRKRYVFLAMFGGQYDGWITPQLVDFIHLLRNGSGKEVVVVSVGRCGVRGRRMEDGLG